MSQQLDAEMRQILAAMSILSCGTTQSWNTSGGGKSDDKPVFPPGGLDSLADHWAREYNAAADDNRRRVVIGKAREALRAEQRQPPTSRPAGETAAQELRRKTKRVLELHQDGAWTRAEIAADVRLTIGQVRTIVATAVLAAPVVLDGPLRERVVALRAENLSQRQIAAKVGVSQQMVCKVLRKEAA